MSSINKATILGRLGDDPKTKQTNDGGTFTSISVATSETWTDKQTGEKREMTEWHRIIFFGKLAEVAAKYLTKGSQVYIEGKIKTSKYTDKEGIERYSTDIVCSAFDSKMVMLGRKNSGQNETEQDQHYSQPQYQQPQQPQQQPQTPVEKKPVPDEMRVNTDEDIPF